VSPHNVYLDDGAPQNVRTEAMAFNDRADRAVDR
jgi:hypothetical protein